jgi:hypothetical protein
MSPDAEIFRAHYGSFTKKPSVREPHPHRLREYWIARTIENLEAKLGKNDPDLNELRLMLNGSRWI